MATRRRSFARVFLRPGSTKWYVRFRCGVREVERPGGPTKDLADRKLAWAQLRLAEGATLEHVLEEVFGDAPEPAERPGRAVTLREASRRFGVSLDALRRWARDRRVRCWRDASGRRLFDEAEVGALLRPVEERRQPTAQDRGSDIRA